MGIVVRPYRGSDAESTLDVFRQAISVTAAEHYSPAQISAWLAEPRVLAEWAAAREARTTAVAEIDGRVVGFTDVDADGYIDVLFVDPGYARRGVATALFDWARAEAIRSGATSLTANVSIGAREFFERQGFRVQAVRYPRRLGVRFMNFAMRREL